MTYFTNVRGENDFFFYLISLPSMLPFLAKLPILEMKIIQKGRKLMKNLGVFQMHASEYSKYYMVLFQCSKENTIYECVISVRGRQRIVFTLPASQRIKEMTQMARPGVV